MRLLIVEDEAIVARRLARLLGQILEGRVYDLQTRSNLRETQNYLKQNRIDLLFLDLNLYGKDGFEILADMVSRSFETIVVSANTDRAIEAFEYGVLDFVAKPFNRDRLEKALARFDGKGYARADQQSAKVLAVRQKGKVTLVPVTEVTAIHGAGNYAELETRDGRTLLHDKSLDRLCGLLPAQFIRIHRSHIVDWEQAVRLETEPGSRYYLVLKTGKRLPVGRSRVAEIKKRLV